MTRSVLITGGNRGIGLAIAEAFAAAGDKVAITYRTGTPPPGFFPVRCDVTDTDSVNDAVEQVTAQQGPVEVMVSNAGTINDGLLLRMSDADFLQVLDTNLLGAMRLTRAVVPGMVAARWGRLIYVSSVTALLGAPGQANYAASKAGLIGLARSVARELGSRRITANVVLPGLVDTDMTKGITDQRRAQILIQTALNRAGTPEEVAAAVTFLAGENAGYITAALLPVTGGAGTGN
ncbi:SDR family oxidoreductase [Amycolatopsis sp. NPDC052450]|uniref:SDR family oxidoreductase n=1 Tax=Amycolatopsis sp. NPDC052450 TaxID=3363937 RepID=UPI0037CB997C